MKKIFSVVIILFVFISNPLFYNQVNVYAESQSEIESQISDSVEEQLQQLDTTSLENLFSEIVEGDKVFGNESFTNKVKSLINGELAVDASTLLNYVGNIFFEDVINYLPYVCLIIAIAVLYSMVSNASSGKDKSIGDIIHFVCYGAIVVIVVTGLVHLIGLTTNCVGSIKRQMDIVFPLLLTLVTALGGNVSVGIFQPAMAVLSGSVIYMFTSILLPIFTIKIVFTIISNLTTNIKFNKFSEFFGSCFKWILGGVITIFTAFVSVQGLMAGSVDSISIRTAKYTIKSGVPLVGGFISDGVSLIMLSCSLIKNAIGVSGLLILFCTMLYPILKILVFSLLIKLAASILEPIADGRVTTFVNDIAKSISTLIALILGVSFMYFILIGLIMCGTNVF